jgi:hypothetical protein
MNSELEKMQRWRNRAKECRVEAECMQDQDERNTLQEIAVMYDRLADRTEARDKPENSN